MALVGLDAVHHEVAGVLGPAQDDAEAADDAGTAPDPAGGGGGRLSSRPPDPAPDPRRVSARASRRSRRRVATAATGGGVPGPGPAPVGGLPVPRSPRRSARALDPPAEGAAGGGTGRADRVAASGEPRPPTRPPPPRRRPASATRGGRHRRRGERAGRERERSDARSEATEGPEDLEGHPLAALQGFPGRRAPPRTRGPSARPATEDADPFEELVDRVHATWSTPQIPRRRSLSPRARRPMLTRSRGDGERSGGEVVPHRSCVEASPLRSPK